MKKIIFCLLAFITIVFAACIPEKAVSAMSAKQYIEFDRQFYYDSDGGYAYSPYCEASYQILKVDKPSWFFYSFKQGKRYSTYVKLTLVSDTAKDNNYTLLNVLYTSGDKGKVKLEPGIYRIHVFDEYCTESSSYSGTKEHIKFCYSTSKLKKTSLSYNVYGYIGDEYYIPTVIKGKNVSTKFSCNKKNKVEFTKSGTIKITGTGKFTVTAKAGKYTRKLKFYVYEPYLTGKTTYVLGSEAYFGSYSFDNLSYNNAVKVTFKSLNSSVASITSDGKLKAKKTGKATIVATFNKKYNFKFKVNVVANEYKNNYLTLDFRNLTTGKWYFYNDTVKFNSDGGISYSAYLVNKYSYTIKPKWIRVEIYNNSGYLVAKQKFDNRKESIDSGDFVKLNFKIDKKNIYKKDVNFYDGYFNIQWYIEWGY